ncbi:putative prophage phiRv2 integrase [Mycobacterium gallinarum]|uniref:Prophage phiRv2 integrase n=1 Tax=Mycobacterium gallinarum TaxID=39689 RepID=A0A9W4AZK9_9MYCO|nr:putative prophage phiRv2 integrase [Mycobacterium gallinarum]
MTRDRRTFGRLRKLPSGRYQAAYIGPDDQLHTAPRTFSAKVDAEGWLSDRRKEIDRELWNPGAGQETKRKPDALFKDYAQTWVETRRVKGRPLRPRTKEHYTKLLEGHIYPTFGKKPLRTITPEMVDKWYAKAAPDTPTTKAHAYSLLRTIFESARTSRQRLIDVNPCMIAGGGSSERKIKPKPLNAIQLGALVESMPDSYRLMVLLATWAAMRFGELVELRRKDIDLDDAVVNISRAAVRVDGGWEVGKPKSDAGIRIVTIPPHIIPAVEHHLSKYVDAKQDSLLFPAKSGGHLQPSTLYRHFYKARVKAGRPDLRWHDLRHSGAVFAAMTGATLKELMDRLGHSTPAAALRYQHSAAGRDKQIAAALSRLADDTPL